LHVWSVPTSPREARHASPLSDQPSQLSLLPSDLGVLSFSTSDHRLEVFQQT
jgi:hypothetical protein